jgi:glycerophosphoryl diester phosphodiesterase
VRARTLVLGAAAVVALGLYAMNNSWSARPEGSLTVLAHRGVHQTYGKQGLTRDSCTATHIKPPTNGFIENTLPSMREAFRLGADAVEFDVHPTTDGEFAVFHDWTLDCRTDGRGVTREQTMARLRTLDVGYGYTADGGRTHPFRGKGVGLMPTLAEVMTAFPGKGFQINIKSNDPREAEKLDAYLRDRGLDARKVTIFGGDRPVRRMRMLRPDMIATSKPDAKRCLKDYLLTGWTGRTPTSCRNAIVTAPEGLRVILWGWPNRFLDRMHRAGSEVYLAGPVTWSVQSVEGVDSPVSASRIPRGWRGGVQTDRIEVVGPLLRPAPAASAPD